MPDIRIVPLGAGQDVGRSCILVSIGAKNVMFDCGMHMGYNDERRFPDFNYITGGEVLFRRLKRQFCQEIRLRPGAIVDHTKSGCL